MDICDGASLELLDMFCYLGDMLSVDGDAEAAVEARVRLEYVRNGISLDNLCLWLPIRMSHMVGKLYTSCVHCCMLQLTWQ